MFSHHCIITFIATLRIAQKNCLPPSNNTTYIYICIPPFLPSLLPSSVVPPTTGLGAQDEAMALSVRGQADRLILEATAVNNLSQMYIGWMPWL